MLSLKPHALFATLADLARCMTKACVLCRATLAPADFSPRFCAECITCLSHNGVDVTPLASPACSRQRPSTPPTLERGVSVQAVTPRRRRRSKTSSRTPKVKNTTLSQAAPSSAAFNPTPIARALLYEARRTKPFTSYDNASRAVSPKDVEKLYPKPSCQDGGSATCPFQVSKSANVISSQFLALSTLGLNIVPKKLRNETGGTQPVSPEQTSFQASKQITSENCVLQCHSTNTDRIRAQSQASDENDGISTSAVKNGNLIANVLSSRTFENRTNTASQSPLIQPTSDGRPKKRRRLERLRSVSPSSVQETPPSAQCSQRSQGETPSRLFATSINQITEKSAKSNPCDENVQPYEQSHARNISARKQTQMKSRMLTPHSRSKPSLQHRTLSTARRPSHSHQYWPAPGVAHAPPDSARFFVLDTETSGLDSTLDRVIEVAITEYHRGQWETPFSLLVNIGDSPLEPSTTVVHGITRQMLVGAPSFAAVWDRVRAYVTIRTLPHETPVIIAHNGKHQRFAAPAQYPITNPIYVFVQPHSTPLSSSPRRAGQDAQSPTGVGHVLYS